VGRPKLPRIQLPPDTIWTCKDCGDKKLVGEFVKNKRVRLGYTHLCKLCHNEHEKKRPKTKTARNAANQRYREKYHTDSKERERVGKVSKIYRRRSYLKMKYGVTEEQVVALRKYQGNKCAICLKPFTKTPCLDHDHETKTLRGLLCAACNLGLGKFEDDTCRLDRAIAYLIRPPVEYRA